jgi:hypothetical protein
MPARKANDSRIRLSKARFRELADEATMDAGNESEQAVGWLTMIEDNVDFPFETKVLGVDVSVVGVDLTNMDELVAVCRRERHGQKIPLVDLPGQNRDSLNSGRKPQKTSIVPTLSDLAISRVASTLFARYEPSS